MAKPLRTVSNLPSRRAPSMCAVKEPPNASKVESLNPAVAPSGSVSCDIATPAIPTPPETDLSLRVPQTRFSFPHLAAAASSSAHCISGSSIS
jgi:hypothetical protein